MIPAIARQGLRALAIVACGGVIWLGGSPVGAAADKEQQGAAAAQAGAAEKSERERVEVIARISPTVISIFRVNQRTGELAAGSGSGVIISADGYALTNFHVTGTFKDLRVGAPGGRIYKARLCGVDRTGDVALIKIESDAPLPWARLGSSEALSVGEWVIALGNPFLLATDFHPTVSLGIVSGLHRYLPGGGVMHKDLIYADAIQVDAALNPGNSGGPLFNLAGEVVGINGRIAPRRVQGMRLQKINAGIGFAVPIDAIKTFLDELKAGHEVDRGYLGVSKVVVLDEGLRIEKIAPDSPAEIFGLKEGDVLLRVDGAVVHGHGQLENMIQVKPAGTRVKVAVRRGEEVVEKTVQLAGVQTVAMLKMAEFQAGYRGSGATVRPPIERGGAGRSQRPDKPEAPADEAEKKKSPEPEKEGDE